MINPNKKTFIFDLDFVFIVQLILRSIKNKMMLDDYKKKND